MNINATLLGQLLTFAVLVGVTMRFIWPPVMKALAERQAQIASGLQAAAEGQNQLAEARAEVALVHQQAKDQAQAILKQANETGQHLIAQAQQKAQEQGAQILDQAEKEVALLTRVAKTDLMGEVSGLVVQCAERLLNATVDEQVSNRLIADLIDSLEQG